MRVRCGGRGAWPGPQGQGAEGGKGKGGGRRAGAQWREEKGRTVSARELRTLVCKPGPDR